jgi:hypothetical protein
LAYLFYLLTTLTLGVVDLGGLNLPIEVFTPSLIYISDESLLFWSKGP